MIGTLFTLGKFGFAAVSGVDALVDASAQFIVKLALRSRKVDSDAGDAMVELMRSRVPVDSGRLLNGISAETDDEGTTVTATAIRGDFDYARAVEFGHGIGARVADADYFAGGGRRPSRATHNHRADAEPFFLDSAEEVLEQRGLSMDDAIASAAGDAGL